MVDEMDLLSGLKTAEPVRPHAFEEARATLRAAMVMEDEVPEPATARGRRPRWSTRRTAGVSVAALGAAAAAVVLVVTSAPAPGHGTAASGSPSAQATAKATATPAAVNPVLAQLAANISVPQVTLPGNATMEVRNQSPTSATPGANGIDLYLNDGTYYWGVNKSDLLRSIAQGQDVGQGAFKRSIAAALLAAKGDVATGRAHMSVANLVPGAPSTTAQAKQAEIEKLKAIAKEKHIKYTPPKPLTPEQKQEQTDNFIWMNSNYALTAAPENPNVRAGVLRIMATMPNVKVTHTTTAGQATLTLSDSWPKLGGDTESLVINARTGLPIASSDSSPDMPSTSTYYHSFRVTLADVEAGKF
jgi:hypothetical protein